MTDKTKRPIIVSVLCILGLLISILEIAGHFYATHIEGTNFDNQWTIYLKIIPFVNIVCWLGFWIMRKATLILYSINILFSMWVQYSIDMSPFDFYIGIYIIMAIVMGTQLSKMK